MTPTEREQQNNHQESIIYLITLRSIKIESYMTKLMTRIKHICCPDTFIQRFMEYFEKKINIHLPYLEIGTNRRINCSMWKDSIL